MNIFFIVGTGRCGTTLLAQMLNSHSLVCVPLELQVLFEYSGNGARLHDVFSSGLNEKYQASDFINLIEQRCPHRLELYFDYRAYFEKHKYPIRDLKSLVTDFYREIALSKGKVLFAEQTPWYGQRIDILNSFFPSAKYVHMVRDGRDVAISYARTPWWHRDVFENLNRWEREVKAIDMAGSQILLPGQMLQVRYEDLVSSPETSLKTICRHLEIEFEFTMLDPSNYIDYSQFSRINASTISSGGLNSWKEKKLSATFAASCLAWKNSSEFDFSRKSDSVSNTLEAFGYEK